MADTENPIVKRLTSSGLLLTLANICYVLIIGIELTAYFYDNLPVSLQVLSIAICCIIIGSINSVVNQNSPNEEVEKLTAKDAYMFPVMGSCVLFSAYILIRYLPAFVLDYAIRILFFAVATFSAQTFISQVMTQFCPQMIYDSVLNIHLLNVLIKWKEYSYFNKRLEFFIPSSITFPKTIASKDTNGSSTNTSNTSNASNNNNNNNSDTAIECRVVDLISLIVGLVVSVIWFTTQHWLSNNIIGIATSIHAIAFLNPGSYYTATVLLSLLFFYDIFWVFGTDVMVTVAKNLNAPIKLIFPRPAEMEEPSMLGLGDIVLPGIYIALLLRYDIWRYLQNEKSKNSGNVSYSTWITCLICYVASLANCLVIMYYFEHAQPALLYLVPGCILPIFALAAFRGDFMTLWKYDEAEPEKTKKAD